MSGAAFSGEVDGIEVTIRPQRDGSFTVTGPGDRQFGRIGETSYQGHVNWSAFVPDDDAGVSVGSAQAALKYLVRCAS